MTIAIFFFFLFAIITFITPIPSFAIFFIILFFFSTAYIMYLVGATFLAMLILIVYVGAIAMLFVFCVILFERTPVHSNYFYYRALIISGSFLIVFYQASDIFFTRFTKLRVYQITKLSVSNSSNTYISQGDVTFLDAFASFFFITEQGLFYMTFIGFFLFFFTLGVTYIFYFTKK